MDATKVASLHKDYPLSVEKTQLHGGTAAENPRKEVAQKDPIPPPTSSKGDSVEISPHSQNKLQQDSEALSKVESQFNTIWTQGKEIAQKYVATLGFLKKYSPNKVKDFLDSIDKAIAIMESNKLTQETKTLSLDFDLSFSWSGEIKDADGNYVKIGKNFELSVHIELSLWENNGDAGYEFEMKLHQHEHKEATLVTSVNNSPVVSEDLSDGSAPNVAQKELKSNNKVVLWQTDVRVPVSNSFVKDYLHLSDDKSTSFIKLSGKRSFMIILALIKEELIPDNDINIDLLFDLDRDKDDDKKTLFDILTKVVKELTSEVFASKKNITVKMQSHTYQGIFLSTA